MAGMKLVEQYACVTHLGYISDCYSTLEGEWGRVDRAPDLYAGVVFIHPGGFIFPVDRDGKVLAEAFADLTGAASAVWAETVRAINPAVAEQVRS